MKAACLKQFGFGGCKLTASRILTPMNSKAVPMFSLGKASTINSPVQPLLSFKQACLQVCIPPWMMRIKNQKQQKECSPEFSHVCLALRCLRNQTGKASHCMSTEATVLSETAWWWHGWGGVCSFNWALNPPRCRSRGMLYAKRTPSTPGNGNGERGGA